MLNETAGTESLIESWSVHVQPGADPKRDAAWFPQEGRRSGGLCCWASVFGIGLLYNAQPLSFCVSLLLHPIPGGFSAAGDIDRAR